MATPKKIISPSTQEQQTFNDYARSRRVSESGFRTQMGQTADTAIDVPAFRPLVLVNTSDTTIAYLARSENASAASAPSGISDSHIAIPPNSIVVWNSGEPTRPGEMVSIASDSADLAVYVSEENLD